MTQSLTAKQVADLLTVNRLTVIRLALAGRLPGAVPPIADATDLERRQWRFPHSAVDSFLWSATLPRQSGVPAVAAIDLEDLQTYDFEYVSKLVGRSVRWLNENADKFEHIDYGRRRRMTAKQIEKFVERRIGGDASAIDGSVEQKSTEDVLLDATRARRARKTRTAPAQAQRRGAA